MQWKAFLYTFCRAFVWRFRARRISVRRSSICNEDYGLWYFTVCNFLLCVNTISLSISFIFLYHVLECEWLTGLVRIHPSWFPYLNQSSALNMAQAWYTISCSFHPSFCYISCFGRVLLKRHCHVWILKLISPYMILLCI